MIIHKPVLLKETIDLLDLKPGMIVIDATLGGGGHSMAILEKILPGGKLIAIDQDEKAIAGFKKTLASLKLNLKEESVRLAHNNFANLKDIVFSLKVFEVHGIVADLGISSDQLKDAKRGFSFQQNGPLDMRMNRELKMTAGDIVNTYSERRLENIFRQLGDERHAGLIARKIVQERRRKPIQTTYELVSVIARAVPKSYQHRKIHFATKTFQAIRMEVNQELENLRKFLSQAFEILKSKGRIAVISFHSGEDRLVKEIFRENARGCICPPEFPICRCLKKPVVKIITARPIVPGKKERTENPRSRSAKLRIAEKI
ncbi:MAG: 16S rRNA (cytosine(1402)-N(4))-methyltransferase RsmH [Candidatus Moranbacteria bacterium]|nr:16S rRNA (cytosine(1402)-N(4))-methyltransferase RsmH [Candidatus Moranbacteria bacterium]